MIGFTDLVLLTSNLICKIKRAWNRQRILSLVFKPNNRPCHTCVSGNICIIKVDATTTRFFPKQKQYLLYVDQPITWSVKNDLLLHFF